MRLVQLIILLLALLTACHNEEEVVPAPPPSASGSGSISQTETPEQPGNPAVGVDTESFQYGSFRSMPYRVLFPSNYDAAKKYPLHIFLHGIGERGTDNEAQLNVGAQHFQADSIRKSYPVIVVFPQCPATHYWFDDAVTDKLRALIDSAVTQSNVDIKNISIGGFSMGAYGTFAMVERNPDLFKSALAISGDGDETKAQQMAQSKWRLFAGERDAVVPSRKTEKMAKALANAGASVSFTLYPEADHGKTWQHAFAEPDFFNWLFGRDANL